jgi:hypothetical protein
MMNRFLQTLCGLFVALLAVSVNAGVVINEIFYNAPEDLEDLEYIELYNSGDKPVDLTGWAFTKGIKFKFKTGTEIAAKGFLVLCRNEERFRQYYEAPIAGTFKQKLSNQGERLELCESAGRTADSVKYQDTAPWPAGADGYSGSLERICPEAGGEDAANWASSPLSADWIRPAGTPGKANANFSATLPPIISNVSFSSKSPAANEAMTVEADVRDGNGSSEVEVTLLYRTAGPGFENGEAPVPMAKGTGTRYLATIPGQGSDQLIRFRIQAKARDGARRFFPAETEPRPALSAYVHGAVAPAKIPFAWMVATAPSDQKSTQRRSRSASVPDLSHRTAFVFYEPAKKAFEVFDFVQITLRSGGVKVHFLKDQPLDRMSTINLIFEGNDRFVLAEPLAYEVYRRAGMPVEQSYHLRLWSNGQPLGYYLLVEQPNRAFLRRNRIDDGGNLYKLIWYGRGLVAQHEKKTNVREGHDDLVELVSLLRNSGAEDQWEVIRKNFDVDEVATYFAVNMVISHWDGFFNNYFTYHDTERTKRWTMYPWDQDKTWGYYDGIRPGQVFYDMPITFGQGDGPFARERGRGGGPFGGDSSWWRPPGYFSGPLLANPQFRKVFLARTREILETVYTEEIFLPIINAMGDRLRDEVKVRAEIMREQPERALARLERNLQDLRVHVQKRRAFLLAQDEIKSVERSSRAAKASVSKN